MKSLDIPLEWTKIPTFDAKDFKVKHLNHQRFCKAIILLNQKRLSTKTPGASLHNPLLIAKAGELKGMPIL
jgi:hypothetical protein